MTQMPLASVLGLIVNLVPFRTSTAVLRHQALSPFSLHLNRHSKNPILVQSHPHPHLHLLKMKMISKKMRLRNIMSTDKNMDVLL